MRVLVINCGSSSVKVRSIDTESGLSGAHGEAQRIGEVHKPGAIWIDLPDGFPFARCDQAIEPTRNHRAAIEWLVDHLPEKFHPEAIGHRVVHGGEEFRQPARINDSLITRLEDLVKLAPLHNPANLAGIRAATTLFPKLLQVAVFDTAFHATLPAEAFRYAIPEYLYRDHSFRRYGFHGLSHRFVCERASQLLGRNDLRIVSLHLGNGCSACAVCCGRAIDTSMGMTPLAGLVMGTRCGDIDPALPLIIANQTGMSTAEVDHLLNYESGLTALSGIGKDMRDIEAAAERGCAVPEFALRSFCYAARKYVGAYAAAMGGLDVLVFTAGIGENSARVREEICGELQFLGLAIDPIRNSDGSKTERDITLGDGPVRVLVIPTNEELVIARDTAAVCQSLATT